MSDFIHPIPVLPLSSLTQPLDNLNGEIQYLKDEVANYERQLKETELKVQECRKRATTMKVVSTLSNEFSNDSKNNEVVAAEDLRGHIFTRLHDLEVRLAGLQEEKNLRLKRILHIDEGRDFKHSVPLLMNNTNTPTAPTPPQAQMVQQEEAQEERGQEGKQSIVTEHQLYKTKRKPSKNGTSRRQRIKCAICSKQTILVCKTCIVGLHTGSCSVIYHMQMVQGMKPARKRKVYDLEIEDST